MTENELWLELAKQALEVAKTYNFKLKFWDISEIEVSDDNED